MTIRDMHYIETIANEKNITRAAQKLFISQPALSQILKKVESELGATLFTRTSDGLQPTFIGEQFLLRTSEILECYHKLEITISDANNLKTGRIKIGIPYYLNGSFLSEILPVYSNKYPKIDVNVIQKADHELEVMLTQGLLDFVIGMPESFSEKFKKSLILQCRLILSPPSGCSLKESCIYNPGEHYPTISPDILEGKTILDYNNGSPLQALTHKILDQSKVTVNLRPLSGYGIEMVRRCSKAGLGFAIIPECMLISRQMNKNEEYYYIEKDNGVFYSICAVWPTEAYMSIAAKKLIELSKQFFYSQNLLKYYK